MISRRAPTARPAPRRGGRARAGAGLIASGLIAWGLVGLAGVPALAQSLEARRATLQALETRAAVLQARIGTDRNALARLLGALELFSRDPPPPLLVSPGDAKAAVRAMILAQAIAPELEARARALAVQAQELAAAQRQAAEASGELFAAESAVEDREGRLDALTRDAARLAPPGPASQGLDAEAPPTRLAAPVAGPVATGFGGRLASGLRSEGLAWKTRAGARVRSPAAAVVAYAGPLKGWGEVVVLRGAGGCHMVLSGLGKVTVAAGQSVAAAFPIGSMPASGHASPELYFEVRLSAGPVDPMSMLDGGLTARRG
ncbi:MAG TPA: peptidoglycan DD-metalloendopeptidase family protein [Caulobacteraceae bacterium]|nr:peptidoglycan DD-metalloendopeptidase family protein [Caulobacteraceae bacterium]